MTAVKTLMLVLAAASAFGTQAQHDPGTSPAVASKVALRGDANGIMIPEIRAVRRNDILLVQTDLLNAGNSDRTVFYRYRWLDNNGNQVGDGESWKQMAMLGQARQTVKSIAPSSVATDFRLEMNVEPH